MMSVEWNSTIDDLETFLRETRKVFTYFVESINEVSPEIR
jgi:hypothetical protein